MIASPSPTRAPPIISRRSHIADAEPGQVEVVAAHHVGVLGRLAAQQRAAEPAGSRRRCPRPAPRSARASIVPQVDESRKKAGRAPDVMTSLTHIATRSTPSPCSRPAAVPSSSLVPTPSQPAASSGSPRLGANRPANPPTPPSTLAGAGRLDRGSDPLDHRLRRVEADARVGVGQRLAVAHVAAASAASCSKRSFESRRSSGISVGYSPVRQARQKRSPAARWPPAGRRARGRRARWRPACRASPRSCGRRRSARSWSAMSMP